MSNIDEEDFELPDPVYLTKEKIDSIIRDNMLPGYYFDGSYQEADYTAILPTKNKNGEISNIIVFKIADDEGNFKVQVT